MTPYAPEMLDIMSPYEPSDDRLNSDKGSEETDEEVDDEKSAQTKVDLNRDLIFPLNTSLLVELVSI